MDIQTSIFLIPRYKISQRPLPLCRLGSYQGLGPHYLARGQASKESGRARAGLEGVFAAAAEVGAVCDGG